MWTAPPIERPSLASSTNKARPPPFLISCYAPESVGEREGVGGVTFPTEVGSMIQPNVAPLQT